MRRRLAIAMLLIAAPALAQQDPVLKSWNQPVEPFRIIGNLFYVGASEVASYLVATPKGHIIIDGGLMETAPMIRANIEKLGFHFQDVRILLNTHAHFDHAGGLAALKEWGGATLMASERDAPLLARGGKNDPQFGDDDQFPAVTPDTLLRDGDHVTLGGSILTAHLTPGHTPGCTTWTMTIREKGKPNNVVIVCSASVPKEYKLVGNNKYPDIVADYRQTFATLKALPCDVFLAVHGSFFDLLGKAARKAKGERPNPFIDPEGYRKYVAAAEQAFEEELKRETPAPSPAASRASSLAPR
ncbi:MAG TPA: subclass B3 metallo-beta-lactamase [Thermoanaerobaculia bacterium]|nr:subclass B3 metallo-beta-lactamase [Thermoanaerobaculia bacterium]